MLRGVPILRIVVLVALATSVACSGSSRKDAARDPEASARRETVVAADAVRARVGALTTFDVVVDPRSVPAASNVPGRDINLAGAFREGARLVVWLVAAGDDERAATSAQFGVAEVRAVADDRLAFTVTGRVPAVVWQRRAGANPGTPIATPAGAYAVVLEGFFRRDLVVDEAAPATAPPPSRPAPAPTTASGDERRVLGERDLAGVAFGSAEADTIARLTARFGPPAFDEPHRSRCGPERLAGWGDLVVVLRAPDASSTAKVFVAYRYSAPHAATREGPQGLQTVSGLEPGMSLAELRVREPRAVFVTDPDDTVLASWYAGPGNRLGGRLSDDVTGDAAAVVEIASSLATLATPTLDDC